MQYTTHYNLNLPEGSDVVNPLVQDNPNYSAIDTALYNNKLRVVGNATEIKSGTVHAITRSDSDIDVIRFTATGNWDTGDTMTVDGTPVSVYLPNGASPQTGAYIINSEVICAINGTRVTLYAGGVSSIDASDVNYDNTLSGLSANKAQGAIDELAGEIGDLSTLTTSDKSSLVAAVNEVKGTVREFIKTYVSGTTDGAGRKSLNKAVSDGYVPIGFANAAMESTPHSWSFASFAGVYYLQYSDALSSVAGSVYWIKAF